MSEKDIRTNLEGKNNSCSAAQGRHIPLPLSNGDGYHAELTNRDSAESYRGCSVVTNEVRRIQSYCTLEIEGRGVDKQTAGKWIELSRLQLM